MKLFIKLIYFFCILATIISINHAVIYSEFLVDDEQTKEKKEKVPENVAGDIKAEVIPNIRGAIRISWKPPEKSDGDYIIGRSNEPVNSLAKVLKATSIKLVPAGAKPMVIDSNLPFGAYFYCVISKKNVIEKKVNLFPDLNYTTIPVIIEREHFKSPVKSLPMQVTLIHTRIITKQRVIISWRSIESRGIIYTIYRGNSQLDTPEKLGKANIITKITDGREGYIDRSITESGTYFYAVTTKNIEGNEDRQLTPDQSYTTSGMYISIGIQKSVSNIQATATDMGSIKISWQGGGSNISEYLVYRYHKPISNSDRLAQSTFLDRTNVSKKSFVDKNPGLGNYYYSVLIKLGDGSIDTRLINGANYTTEPISIGREIKIISISTEIKENSIKIKWKIRGNIGSKNYKIARREDTIKTITDIEDSFIVDYVNVFDQSYFDEDPPSGKYFYAIVPEDVNIRKGFKLFNGVNVTDEPIIVKKGSGGLGKQLIISKGKKVKGKKIEKKVTPHVESQKKLRKDLKKKEKTYNNQRVDIIIRDFFFQRKYNIVIKKLQNIINISDNEYEVAKSRLFIGRSWLEMKEYQKALEILLMPEVNRHFPTESHFWREIAISKADLKQPVE